MPLYEYCCESCGRTIEVIQSYAEPPMTLCDRCGGPLKRLVSAPAVQFKGSGWYVNDYGKSGSAGTAGKKSDGGDPGSASSGKSESSSGSADKGSSDKSSSDRGSSDKGSAPEKGATTSGEKK